MEKMAYTGQVAARIGIISLCNTQQDLASLLSDSKGDSPNLDETIQTARDIFAISTKSLDQFARTGAFHHLIRRKDAIADSGLHDCLRKSALNSSIRRRSIWSGILRKV